MNFKRIRQRLLLNEGGRLIASCDSIFSSGVVLGELILPYFPLVESVFPIIRRLQLNDPEVAFGGVETTFEYLPGIYNFTFVRMNSENGEFILWIIEDQTKNYKEKISKQQIKNEMAIAKELLSRF